ncbi:hypothetical protein V5O48_017328 [Marasmius crinis-equi]|uniref:Uncharacterized protein n=1 Tax=Marasmius crinis-equi TaxID=585013 RepID=A0ABR3EPB7_9AGAR
MAGDNPTDFKVDEQRGLVINVTGLEGDNSRLTVVDKADRVLWTQPWPFMKSAKMEYDNGYLIFTENHEQEPGHKEVWRLATILDTTPSPKPDPQKDQFHHPTPSQMKLSAECYIANKATYPHGHFVPHASFRQYRINSLSRFHYPILTLLTSEATATFYHVPMRALLDEVTLSSVINLPNNDGPVTLLDLGRLYDIEFSSDSYLCLWVEEGLPSLRQGDRESVLWMSHGSINLCIQIG